MSWSMTANKGNGGGSVKAPAGNHRAVLVGIFDMGHQWQDAFDKSKEGKWQHRAYFVWELVDEAIAGANKNHVIGIDLTLSLNEKAKLRKWIEARTGKQIPDGAAFDPTSELGQPCMLNVVMKGDWPRVEGVSALSKRDAASPPKPTYPPTAVLLSEFQSGTAIPEWCPYLFGSPLADHVNASRELGGAKPTPKKAAAPATVPPDDGPPAPDADLSAFDRAPESPDPAARWDYHDGKAWVKGVSTQAVTAHIEANDLNPSQVWVRPPGDQSGAKRADEYGFANQMQEGPIPY
jgi:hypothetical protein